ncbi:unnamed protein product [Parnassius apollo]|uniref:(apollo) hypothetical protein n=1 Tax=Parnassius apollo TaxID=110799 RepID=A0A8S3Y1Z7_PARAO|nr:unnamed protein product [Parnassius apollo]
MASNKRKIQILENRVIRPAIIDSDSDSSEEIFSTKKTKKGFGNKCARKTKHKRSPSGRKFHILKPVSFSHVTKTECKNKPTPQTSKGLSSPSSSSFERFSMYSSRGCSPSLNNISASKFEENERQKQTLNDEAEREKETENVDVEDVEEREEETGNAEEEDEDAEREEETENTEEEDEEQESGDTGDDESDEYSASEVVSDIDNDVSEEEEDAQDNSVNEWDAVTDLTPELDACTLNESTFNIPIEDISPAGIFSLFVTDEIIDKMVTETNKYALKHIAEKQNNNEIKTKSRLLSWKATNNIEMRKFLGVLLAMGLNKVSHINDYWSKKSIYRNEYIVSVMTRDRFLLLLKFWHFCDDSSAIHNTNKLKKIHDLANMLNSRFQEVLTPGICRLLLKAIPTFPCFNIVRRSTSATENQVKPKDNDHVLEMSAKRRNCAGCYDRLRKIFNSTEAKKKVKKIKKYCRKCNQNLCVTCFQDRHK